MKIGVIGVGEIGGILAEKWCAGDHDVTIANSRGPEAVRVLAAKIGATPGDIFTAVEGAEVILLSMPFPAISQLPKRLFEGATDDVVIIDTANYYPEVRDPRIEEIDDGMPESVWVSQQLGRPIVKAFNSIMFHAQSQKGKPPGSADRLAVPVAGDDPQRKRIVMQLIDQAGFDPVDGGPLAESWRQQPSTPAYCCDYGADMTLAGLAAAIKGKAEIIRDTAWREKYLKLFENRPDYAAVHDDVISLNRSLNPLSATVPRDASPSQSEQTRRTTLSTSFRGGCACGALRYEIAGEPVFQNHCQCRDCQKTSGTGHGSYLSFMGRSDAKISGKATKWSVAADTGNDKAYAFCPTCGSSVYVTFSAMPELIAITAASLDDPGQFRPEALTYSVRGHAWDPIDSELQHFERMPG